MQYAVITRRSCFSVFDSSTKARSALSNLTIDKFSFLALGDFNQSLVCFEQVTQEVRKEAASKSGLDQYYQGMIDWTNDDAVRRR
jgi:hypothetical protein